MYLTHVLYTPIGTSCSALHATVQAWQPMHLRWSITKAYFVMLASLSLVVKRNGTNCEIQIAPPISQLHQVSTVRMECNNTCNTDCDTAFAARLLSRKLQGTYLFF